MVGDDVVCLRFEAHYATAIGANAVEEVGAHGHALGDEKAFAGKEVSNVGRRLVRLRDNDAFDGHDGGVWYATGWEDGGASSWWAIERDAKTARAELSLKSSFRASEVAVDHTRRSMEIN